MRDELSDEPGASSRVTVVIATTRRPAVIEQTVRHLLDTQSVKPDAVIVSGVTPDDAGGLAVLSSVRVITGPPGLVAQRNAALAHLPAGTEVVAFFDDDFVVHPDWLSAAVKVFVTRPEVVGLTGHVVADGIKGPGLAFEEAAALLAATTSEPGWTFIDPYSPYGCNMAFRLSAIGELRFDERLVLYGWLEDRDFGAALARKGGRLVKCAAARGVHMGVKAGRVAGHRLGYSQIVNPIYMLRKGTMTYPQVIDHVTRNVTSNIVRSFVSEAFIDRRGRLRGNLAGLADLLRGRVEPERAAMLTDSRRNSTRT